MHPCIYTKDKFKKLKNWLEGYYTYKNNKITVYDTDKKYVCTKQAPLINDIDTFKYLIYIEDLVDDDEKIQNKFVYLDENEKEEIFNNKSGFKCYNEEDLKYGNDNKEDYKFSECDNKEYFKYGNDNKYGIEYGVEYGVNSDNNKEDDIKEDYNKSNSNKQSEQDTVNTKYTKRTKNELLNLFNKK